MNGPTTTRPFMVLSTAGPVPVTVCQFCAGLVLARADGAAPHARAHRAPLRASDDQEGPAVPTE